MNKKIFYLSPQEEGKQEFVCWGFEKSVLAEADHKSIAAQIDLSLEQVRQLNDKWNSERSFSVLLGQDKQNFWVAVPRQLATKTMAIFNQNFKALGLNCKTVITSYNNSFDYDCPFYPVISYDRGFVYDASAIAFKDEMVEHLHVVNA